MSLPLRIVLRDGFLELETSVFRSQVVMPGDKKGGLLGMNYYSNMFAKKRKKELLKNRGIR